MTRGDDGGQAFPMATFYAGKEERGMTLRDWLAGAGVGGVGINDDESTDGTGQHAARKDSF